MEIRAEVQQATEEMISLRRDFHQHPELGFQENRTSGIIEQYLKDLGLRVRRCAGTGVIGVLEGARPGRTLRLRSDIDALPVQERTGLPFASQTPGVMHACGHDGHTAIQLLAAKLLARRREQLAGKLIFLFQPNEEEAGAEEMIRQGALEDPRPDAVCGLHLWSPLPTGTIGVVPGPLMASSYYFKVTIHGVGGHGGAPHTAVNPIDAAGHVLEAIKTFHTLEMDACKPTVISVCTIHSGAKQIVVPETLEMEGSIRCLHSEDEQVRRRFCQLVEGTCALYRCTCEIVFTCGNTLLSNDPEMSHLVAEVAARTVGEEHIQQEGISTMLGEDFAEFTRRVPGVFYFVGTGNPEKGTQVEHHNPRFMLDEDSLPIALEMQVRMALAYLTGQP